MRPARWQEIKEIFHSAVGLAPAERAAYLASACAGRDSLRREVESLICAHERTGSFIDSPAYEAAADSLLGGRTLLEPGRKLGAYEILSALGRGGMGEVYLAEDKRLGRKVALKLLLSFFAEDSDRLRRFTREARAASALNHPNIITIHEIGQADSLHFIATEFVEGETLRGRLSRARLSLDEALHIAIQIADALSAAHKAGIIHRDIKPENVMLRPDGYVKVLDFGLAKFAETTARDGPEAVTAAKVRTAPGVVMGTVGYMSPEQARGLAVDERTDVFSLGAVLYEMITGRRPFEGDTPSDVLASVLTSEPPPVSRFAPEAPAELARIVSKALRKDREERYQTVKDLLVDLKSLKQELEFVARLGHSVATGARTEPDTTDLASHAAEAGEERPASADKISANKFLDTRAAASAEPSTFGLRRTKRKTLLLVSAGLLLALVGLAFYAARSWKRPAHFQAIRVTQLTDSRNLIHAAISPDGKYIAYVAADKEQQSLWLRQLNAANDLQVVPPAALSYWGVTFSRDGSDLYYVTRDESGVRTLYSVPALGGTPRRLLADVDSPVAFSPDGKRMAFVRGRHPSASESALVVADADGGDERVIATRRSPAFFYPISSTGPSWSPDGELVACAVADLGDGRNFDLYAFSVKDGTEERLTPQRFHQMGRVEWLSDMSGLVVVGTLEFIPTFPGQLWLVSYPGGETRRITHDFNSYRDLSLTSDSGRIVTVASSDLFNIWVAPDGDAARAAQVAPVQGRGYVSWTPDGRIAYAAEIGGRWDVWIVNADGSNRRQLTHDAGDNLDVSVSPDGRRIAFLSTRAGRGDVWLMDTDGGSPRQLTRGLLTWQISWSPDGRWLYFTNFPDGKIRRVSVDGGEPAILTDRPAYRPVVSPDGKWMACYFSDTQAAASGETVYRLAILPAEGGAPVKVFEQRGNTDGGGFLQWTPDGRAILYAATNNNVSNVWSQPTDGGPAKQLTDFKDGLITSFAYSRDGRWLACTRGSFVRDAVLVSEER